MVEIEFEADQGEGQRSSGANNLYFEDFDMSLNDTACSNQKMKGFELQEQRKKRKCKICQRIVDHDTYGIDLANLNVYVQLLQTSFLKEWSQTKTKVATIQPILPPRFLLFFKFLVLASAIYIINISPIDLRFGLISKLLQVAVNNILNLFILAYAAIIEVGYEKIQKEKNQMELSLEAGINNIFILKRMNWFKPLDCDNSYILLATERGKLGFTNRSRRIKRHRAEVGIPGVGVKIEIESISFKSRSGID
ncbi:hypothetical protein LXL04_013094 [Taraxacum kok-saghyz]